VWATRWQLVLLAASGVIGFAFGDSNGFRSLLILGPARYAPFFSLPPIFTMLLAWPVLGEHPGPRALIGTALTVGGVVWALAGRGDGGRPVRGSLALGIVSGLLGAVGQGAGYVLSKLALRTGIDPLSANCIRAAAGAVAMWLLALVARDARATLGEMRDRRTAALVVAGVTLGPFIGVVLSLVALLYIEAGIAASISAIAPILTILIAATFHRERVTARLLAGAMVAVVGVVVLFLR
jgi:drug/metabolite transporter (DMT)-like permease